MNKTTLSWLLIWPLLLALLALSACPAKDAAEGGDSHAGESAEEHAGHSHEEGSGEGEGE